MGNDYEEKWDKLMQLLINKFEVTNKVVYLEIIELMKNIEKGE